MRTPVALLVFNRPEMTRAVFAAIAKARPNRLFIIADGPRPERPGEADRCAEVRRIVDRVDWPCEVSKCYSNNNLGCGMRVSSGIDWVFSQVDEAVILEDDCLPCPDFFRYCAELLERYRNDERIMHISGSNVRGERPPTADSYYFSKYPLIWGWATWKRAWQHYDVHLRSWPAVRDSEGFAGLFRDPLEREYYREAFESFHAGRADTWDVQWTYACWLQGGLCITPEKNLVSNIGFGPDATHTKGADSAVANLATGAIGTLRHPNRMIRHSAADERFFYEHIGGKEFREMRRFSCRARMTLGAWRRRVAREAIAWARGSKPSH